MGGYLDSLLNDYIFKAVNLGEDTKFIQDKHNCKLLNFLTRVVEDDVAEEILKEYEYIISSLDITCFINKQNAVTIIDETLSRLSSKHEVLKRYLIFLKLKFTEKALLYKLSLNVEQSNFKLIQDIQELSKSEITFNKMYYDKIQDQLSEPQTDVVKLDVVELLKTYEYSDYSLPKKIKYVLYRYHYNVLVRDYKTYTLLTLAYYRLGRGLSKEQLVCKVRATDRLNKLFKLEDKDIKESLQRSNEMIVGLEKALIVFTGNFKIEDNNGYWLRTKFLIPQELLLGSIDAYLISLSQVEFRDDNPLSVEEILITLVSIKDSIKLLEEIQIKEVTCNEDRINKAISSINTINTVGVNITEVDVKKLDVAIYEIKELSHSTVKDTKEIGSKADFGTKRVTGTKDILNSVEDINKDYKDALSKLTRDLNNNSKHIDTSLAALLGLQTTLIVTIAYYSKQVDLVQKQLDLISETVNDLKQTVCLLTSMMCFLGTLDSRINLTLKQITNQKSGYLEAINDMKNSLDDMWGEFDLTASKEIREELNLQIKNSVKAKVLPLVANSSGNTYKPVKDAILKAIDITSKKCIDGSQDLIDSEINSIKSDVKTSSKHIVDNLSESVDTDRCKVNPLFDIPKMLSWNIEGFSLGIDLLGSLDFSLRNCKE